MPNQVILPPPQNTERRAGGEAALISAVLLLAVMAALVAQRYLRRSSAAYLPLPYFAPAQECATELIDRQPTPVARLLPRAEGWVHSPFHWAPSPRWPSGPEDAEFAERWAPRARESDGGGCQSAETTRTDTISSRSSSASNVSGTTLRHPEELGGPYAQSPADAETGMPGTVKLR